MRKIGEVERKIISQQEWQSARQEILAREKTLMRAHDELAAERRRQPWMKIEKNYTFTGPSRRVDAWRSVRQTPSTPPTITC
jgi:predicted dithiol-disulfide oxidoreductase (DUF899 family)